LGGLNLHAIFSPLPFGVFNLGALPFSNAWFIFAILSRRVIGLSLDSGSEADSEAGSSDVGFVSIVGAEMGGFASLSVGSGASAGAGTGAGAGA